MIFVVAQLNFRLLKAKYYFKEAFSLLLVNFELKVYFLIAIKFKLEVIVGIMVNP